MTRREVVGAVLFWIEVLILVFVFVPILAGR